MSAPGVPVADRLRRIASVRLARPLSETSDPARSASVAQRLGTLAAITGTAAVDALADALSGGAPMPPAVADRLTRGLGPPDGTLDPDTDFARGVATIEHCSWRTPDRPVYDPDVARRIAESSTAVCRCISGDWRDFLDRLGPNARPLTDAIRAMRETGVRFVAGTDAGVPGSAFDDYAGMFEFFAATGFGAGEILDMATAHAADALGLGHVTGRLRAGISADVLGVDGDPADGPSVLRRPRLVLAAGRDALGEC